MRETLYDTLPDYSINYEIKLKVVPLNFYYVHNSIRSNAVQFSVLITFDTLSEKCTPTKKFRRVAIPNLP